MKLTIDIDLNTDSREQIAMVANLLNTVTNAARRPTSTQPQVVDNSGSTGPGLDLSPGDSVVAGAEVKAAEAEPNSAPAVVKRTRRTKAEMEADAAELAAKEAAALVEKLASSQTPAASVAAAVGATTDGTAPNATAPALTVDDVRAALQKFTGAKGMPAGIDMLKEFGAARISELKAERFGEFIAKCEVAA
jgi:hypothetical protein